jgi:hypothetical protein
VEKFCWVIVVACAWEMASFLLRALGAHNQQNIGYAISSQLLLLTAPLWINAFAYMIVGRMIYFFLPERKVYGVKATWLAKFFIWLDIFSFIVQAVGGSMLSNQDSASVVRLGMTIYRIGIGIQELFIILFLILTYRFHVRMSELDQAGQVPRSYRWRLLIWNVYAILALITVSLTNKPAKTVNLSADRFLQMRIIYRFVEFSQGMSSSNPILTNEGYAYGLDALPMLLAATSLNVVHPALVLKGPDSEFPRLSRKEKKTIKQEKKNARDMEKAEKRLAKEARKQKQRDGEGPREAVSEPGLVYDNNS